MSRCRHHVEACLDYLRQAHEAALFEEPAEVLAMQLRGALDQLGELVAQFIRTICWIESSAGFASASEGFGDRTNLFFPLRSN